METHLIIHVRSFPQSLPLNKNDLHKKNQMYRLIFKLNLYGRALAFRVFHCLDSMTKCTSILILDVLKIFYINSGTIQIFLCLF